MRVRVNTRVGQMRPVRDKSLNFSQSHPESLDNHPLRIRTVDVEDGSLQLNIHCGRNTGFYDESLEVGETRNLRFTGLAEEAGARFAMPSRALYMEGGALTASS